MKNGEPPVFEPTTSNVSDLEFAVLVEFFSFE